MNKIQIPVDRELKILLLGVMKKGFFSLEDIRALSSKTNIIDIGGADLSILTDDELEEIHRIMTKLRRK